MKLQLPKMTFLNASIAMGLFFSVASYAQNIQHKEIILKDMEHDIQLNLNKTSVRCSDLGYSNTELKISVNDLEWISFFDHTNRGESEPCMTAGIMSCSQINFNFMPLVNTSLDTESKIVPDTSMDESDMLTRFQSLGKVRSKLRQVLKEKLTIDLANKTCKRHLEEEVFTTIDGVEFKHYRRGDLGEYPFDICFDL